MRFSLFQCAAAGLAMCTGAVAQLTSDQVVSNIQDLTSKSQDLQTPANSITIVNGPLIIIGMGPFPQIINGFTEIINMVKNDITAMTADTDFADGPDSDNIFAAFKEFVAVHQQLLSILIGKAGLFNVVPFIGTPVASVLRSLEAVVDVVALSLINTVQSHAADFQSQINTLDGTLTLAINAYEGITGSS